MRIFRDYIFVEKKKFENILKSRKENIFSKDLSIEVQKILEEVRFKGDSAVVKCTKIFDKVRLNPDEFKVKEKEFNEAYNFVSKEFLSALRIAKDNIYNFHKRQIQKPIIVNKNGVNLYLDIKPINRVGVYVPGGEYSYISVLLMCVIPAKIAKVPEVVVCSPVRNVSKRVKSELLVAAKESQVDEFYKIGGVQAIGSLAYGTNIIKKVDKIVGPGNVYVTEAKRQVFGIVGIDSLAGPSEIMIVADETANPEFISYDLLAQAEHDKNALSILITTSEKLAKSVNRIVDSKLQGDYPRTGTVIVNVNILIIIVKDMDRATDIINDYGPEHLEIILKDNEKFASKIKNAGSILIGEYSPAALTDYTAGVNHVLPTGGAAKFSSVLTVNDFIKKVNIVKISKIGFSKLAKSTSTLAEIEGFNYHSSSIKIRLK